MISPPRASFLRIVHGLQAATVARHEYPLVSKPVWRARISACRSTYMEGSHMNAATRETARATLERPQNLVAESGLDGWLVADFRWNNPLFARLLGLQSGILTRRSFLWLPARGAPHAIASRTDGHAPHAAPCDVTLYGGYAEMPAILQRLLPREGRIAMEYVEGGALPTVSRVDAGLIEV